MEHVHKGLEFVLEKYRLLTNIVGTILLAWMLSGVAAQMIGFLIPKPKGPAVPSAAALDAERPTLSALGARDTSFYMPICERNIFDSQKRTVCLDEVPTEEEFDPNAPPVKSDLGAVLLGTMVFTNPSISFATVAASAGAESQNYRIGDSLPGDAKIYDIQRNQLFFTRRGRKEYIEVDRLPSAMGSAGGVNTFAPPAGEGIRISGDNITITRAKVEASLGDLNKIIQDSRMSPNVGPDGRVDGFKVFAIRKGSLFEQLSLKNGDVIQKINGTAIDSIEKALPMLQLLKSESSISIEMSRGGAKKTLSIAIQ